MAHNIYQDRALVYVGKTPWHGLGTRLPANATYEQIKPLVGFYDVEERPVYAQGLTSAIPDRKALVRADTGQYLTTVGIDYGVIQIEDSARAVLTAARSVDGAAFHTAGLLGDAGARYWLLGELGQPFKVGGYNSEIRKYILATSAHDGSSPHVLKNTPTCVVCANTLRLSLLGGGDAFKVRHTSNAAQRVQAAAEALGGLVAQYQRVEEIANTLAATRFTRTQFDATIDAVLPIEGDGEKHPRTEAKRVEISNLWNRSVGGEGVKDNAWSAYQSWTEFADHYIAPSVREDRLQAVWFGRSADVADRALVAIAAQAGIKALPAAA